MSFEICCKKNSSMPWYSHQLLVNLSLTHSRVISRVHLTALNFNIEVNSFWFRYLQFFWICIILDISIDIKFFKIETRGKAHFAHFDYFKWVWISNGCLGEIGHFRNEHFCQMVTVKKMSIPDYLWYTTPANSHH